MAVMLPFLFNMIFVLLFVIVALTYVVMKNDKRYQKIIEYMRKTE
jgi:flagellar biogenesis protein FliO